MDNTSFLKDSTEGMVGHSLPVEYIIGGIPVVLKKGDKEGDYIIDSPKVSSRFAVIARLLDKELENTFDCECGFLNQQSDYARLANTFIRPCQGISIQGFPHNEPTPRVSVSPANLKVFLAAFAARMPDSAALSDHIEKLEENEEWRANLIAGAHAHAKALEAFVPRDEPVVQVSHFGNETVKVHLVKFRGGHRLHLNLVGEPQETWKFAQSIAEKLKVHKLACDLRAPLNDHLSHLHEHAFITFNADKPLGAEDYNKWRDTVHQKDSARLILYPSPVYSKGILAKAMKIPTFEHVDRALAELAPRYEPPQVQQASWDASEPKGKPVKSDEFHIGNKKVTLERYSGDSRFHIKIAGAMGDMMELVHLIGYEIMDQKLICAALAKAEYKDDKRLINCFLDTYSADGFDLDKDLSGFDWRDHFTDPTHIMIYPGYVPSFADITKPEKEPTYDDMKNVLSNLAERYPPFMSDTYPDFYRKTDEMQGKWSIRQKELSKRLLPYAKAVVEQLERKGIQIPEDFVEDIAAKLQMRLAMKQMQTGAELNYTSIVDGSNNRYYVEAVADYLSNNGIQLDDKQMAELERALVGAKGRLR